MELWNGTVMNNNTIKNETGIVIRANEAFTRTWIIPYLHLAGYSR